MSTGTLDGLMERLTNGEPEAAEQVFQNYEPVLRVMVRRWLTPRLRAKFDSMDVVQSVWADVLKNYKESGWRFTDAQHMKAFLSKVTYHSFVNNCRHNSRALEREQPFLGGEQPGLPESHDPRPSQLVQAEELWDKLLALCPPAHRELLRLKREGLGLDEIAARTGLHPSSVRRIIYDLSRKLASAK